MLAPSRFPLWQKTALALLALALALWALLQYSRPRATIVVATLGKAINAVPGTVTVQAERTVDIKSEVSGRILNCEAEIGKPVSADALIAQIDPADIKIEIERLELNRTTARKRVEIGSPIRYELINAEEALATAQLAFDRGGLSASELERQKRSVQLTRDRLQTEQVLDTQTLESFENDLKKLHRTLEKMTIRTPVSGIVTELFAKKGDVITANQPLATVISDARIVEAKVSEENLSGLKIGQTATVRFLSYGLEQMPARISRILPAADPATQRYIVHLDVDVDPKRLLPGLTGEANIIVDAREDAIIVPRRAVVGRTVLVVKNGVVETRSVELGFSSLNRIEIRSGLAAGESVIVDQPESFYSGQRVSTQERSN